MLAYCPTMHVMLGFSSHGRHCQWTPNCQFSYSHINLPVESSTSLVTTWYLLLESTHVRNFCTMACIMPLVNSQVLSFHHLLQGVGHRCYSEISRHSCCPTHTLISFDWNKNGHTPNISIPMVESNQCKLSTISASFQYLLLIGKYWIIASDRAALLWVCWYSPTWIEWVVWLNNDAYCPVQRPGDNLQGWCCQYVVVVWRRFGFYGSASLFPSFLFPLLFSSNCL